MKCQSQKCINEIRDQKLRKAWWSDEGEIKVTEGCVGADWPARQHPQGKLTEKWNNQLQKTSPALSRLETRLGQHRAKQAT